ncbi:hypothetical protein [Burkholderia multivorans]|uniref:hypothetical protein n=1 Tax=Burkholderia multivorans TaxID=87883 RepID=UPI0021C22C11|nr:hypothetical protein [Burkholderia multivorans]
MIDISKMKALAKHLRVTQADCNDSVKAADAIDLLLAELEAAAADKRDADRYHTFRKINLQQLAVLRYQVNQEGKSLDDLLDALAQRQEGESQ